MTDIRAEIAANRFGIGARPGEIERARRDPRGWLRAQLQPLAFGTGAGGSADALRLQASYVEQLRGARGNGQRDAAVPIPARAAIVRLGEQMTLDTLAHAIRSEAPFAVRVLDFFSNHFSVTGDMLQMRALAPALEREAIAPHIAGRFEDLLLAVERHPAMLVYLNNATSFGPGSPVGRRGDKGLNENLAREILELHTLGVDGGGGYTQADVRELAMGITGWSVGVVARGEPPGFMYRERTHEPGARTLLGTRYAQSGAQQGEAMLRALARHPVTARHVSFKLARHFVADDPPPALVDALSARWIASGGDLAAVLGALIDAPAAWEPAQRKLKTPREFAVSALRALGHARANRRLARSLEVLGQKPFGAGSPAGFGDVTDSWNGAEALMVRIDWANQLAGLARADPATVAANALGGQLTAHTRAQMKGAESRQQALALLLMSPEFQRR